MEQRAGVNIADNTTFSDFAQMWVDVYKRPHLSKSGLDDLLRTLNRLIMPTLASYKLRDIKPVHIQRMMADISGYSHRSQSKALATARAVFDAAVGNNIIMRSPVPTTLKARGKMTEEKTPLTQEQTERLLTAVEGTRAYTPVVMMLGLGLRREEALGLMWSDIDFDAHCVHIRRTNVFPGSTNIVSENMKSAAAKRDIPMAPWVEEALLKVHSSDAQSLYVAPRRGWTTDDTRVLPELLAGDNQSHNL